RYAIAVAMAIGFRHFVKNVLYVANFRPIFRRCQYRPVHGVPFWRMTVQRLNCVSHKMGIAHYLLLFELEVPRVEIVDVLIVGESHNENAFFTWPTTQSLCTGLILVCFIPTKQKPRP